MYDKFRANRVGIMKSVRKKIEVLSFLFIFIILPIFIISLVSGCSRSVKDAGAHSKTSDKYVGNSVEKESELAEEQKLNPNFKWKMTEGIMDPGGGKIKGVWKGEEKKGFENDIRKIAKKFPGKPIRVYVMIINPNEEVDQFVREFEIITLKGSVSVLREMASEKERGGEIEYPITLEYSDELNKELVVAYARAFEKIFSGTKNPVKIPPPVLNNNIPEGLNMLIVIHKKLYFDKKGSLYFKK